MEIPTWFGITEYYAIITTVWFALIMMLLIQIVKAQKELKKLSVKEKFTKIKSWWKERKEKKEENPYV